MNFDTRPSLFSRLRTGEDDHAWREFDARYRELVLRYCAARGLQPDDAEDVLQMVLMGFARALANFRYDPGKGRFRSYLGRCVAHAIARLKQGRRLDAGQIAGEFVIELEDPAQSELDREWEVEWTDHHLRLAMESVRSEFEPRSIEVFEYLKQGASIEETAQHFAMTVAAVHKVKQRVRERLRERVAEQIAAEDPVDAPGG
ncbi:MAG: sigma-70 family RNA polymerase sigma factor [Planctomycetes bacterium]|nr:sigma-70 family RNA polymerase sigma factor [Planctomycetota bacterium]